MKLINTFLTGIMSVFILMIFSVSSLFAQSDTANLQIIHNSPDPAVSSVDIYVSGDEFLTGVDFRAATAFTEVPAGVDLNIEIAPAGAGIENAVGPFTYNLADGENYVLVASGVVDEGAFTGAAGFSLEVYTPAWTEAQDPSKVAVNIQHGSPDAPAVDIYLNQTGETAAVADFAYPDFTGYVELDPVNEVVGIAGAGGEVLVEFAAPFADLNLEGGALTVLASGFFDESNASEGNSFGLLAVLPDGTTLMLDVIQSVTISEARNLGTGELVKVEGIVTRAQGAFTYFQDETAGITVRQTFGDFFDAVQDGSVGTGTRVSVIGTTSEFRQLFQINAGDFYTYEVLEQDVEVPAPSELTLAEIAQGGEQYEAMLVSVNNVTVSTDDTEYSASTTYDIEDPTDDSGAVTLRIPNASDTQLDGMPVIETFNFTGVIGQFDFDDSFAGYQLLGIYSGDIQSLDARVQIIHNSADPAVASVDIFVNGDLALPDVAFRSATGFLELPGDTPLDITVAPEGAGIENGVEFSGVEFGAGQNYYVAATGVLDPSSFADNPDEVGTGFFLDVIPNASLSAEAGNFDFLIYHGSTDAPAVDIFARDIAPLAENVAYTGYTPDYISVPAGEYVIDIHPAGAEDPLVSFDVDASGLGGATGIVLASGFLDPSANQDGEGFGLIVVLADGTVVEPGLATSTEEIAGKLPDRFELNQNYPNPFNPTTQISYSLPENADVRVDVYNITGQRVATLVNNRQAAGQYSVTFDAASLASGMYMYRIQAGTFTQVRKMMLLK